MPIKQPFLALLLVFLCGLFIPLHGQQNTYLHIRQADDKPVPYAKINGSLRASENGMFIWNKAAYPQITISAWNFADTTLIAADYIGVDTAYIYLRPQPEQLNEVLVNPKNKWLQNYIYGFERWQNGWLFLLHKEIYVTNDNLDILYKSPAPKPDGRLPKQLYQDVLNNIYVMGKDSAQQLFVTDSIFYVYPTQSIKAFEYAIKPLLAETKDGLLYREVKEQEHEFGYLLRSTATYFTFHLQYPVMHNCGAIIKHVVDSNETFIYSTIDTADFRAAGAAFNAVVAAYIGFWKIFEEEGYFNKVAYAKARHTYKTQFALLKRIYVQSHMALFHLFDPYAHQLITLNKRLEVVEKQPFDFTNCPREEYLYVDNATRKWWLQRRVRGLDQLESVRPGDPPKTIILDPFVRNIRVHNNVVFYITERDQFRVKKIE
jgi:hypothetical protein